MAHVSPLIQYGRFYISGVIFRFFAYDFDYESLSLRISEGGVLPKRTKNPFVQKVKMKMKRTKGKSQARNVGENGVGASDTTKAGPTPARELEAEKHEEESRGNPEAKLEESVQEYVEPEQAIEQSDVVGMLEQVTVKVGLTLLECAWNAHPSSLRLVEEFRSTYKKSSRAPRPFRTRRKV